MEVYGFNPNSEPKKTEYVWPEHGHYIFSKTLGDTPENRISLYEEFFTKLQKLANEKVVLFRMPPSVIEEADGSIKKVRLTCRFSIAEQEEAANGQ